MHVLQGGGLHFFFRLVWLLFDGRRVLPLSGFGGADEWSRVELLGAVETGRLLRKWESGEFGFLNGRVTEKAVIRRQVDVVVDLVLPGHLDLRLIVSWLVNKWSCHLCSVLAQGFLQVLPHVIMAILLYANWLSAGMHHFWRLLFELKVELAHAGSTIDPWVDVEHALALFVGLVVHATGVVHLFTRLWAYFFLR